MYGASRYPCQFGLACSLLLLRLPAASFVRGQPVLFRCMGIIDVFVKFGFRFPLFQNDVIFDIKLAHDALKELVETNTCKYTIEVATLLNVPF